MDDKSIIVNRYLNVNVRGLFRAKFLLRSRCILNIIYAAHKSDAALHCGVDCGTCNYYTKIFDKYQMVFVIKFQTDTLSHTHTHTLTNTQNS